MIKSGVIRQGVMYFHTADDGKVYDYEDRSHLLFDLKELTGQTSVPSVLKDYMFTSSVSQAYFNKCMAELEERKMLRQQMSTDNYAYT